MNAMEVLREAAQRLRARGEAKLAAQATLAARAVELAADRLSQGERYSVDFWALLAKAYAGSRMPTGAVRPLNDIMAMAKLVGKRDVTSE